MGFGVGAVINYLYHTDNSNASKSQFQIGGQYSNTKSFNTFLKNNAWYKNNQILSSTNVFHSSINSEFTSDGNEVAYNTNSLLISQILMFKIANNIYLGGPLNYKRVKYLSNNLAGEKFLEENGIQNEFTGAFGLATSYDSRKNKYYPSNASWVSLVFNANPEWLGAIDSYYSIVIDSRFYKKGFSYNDVWASQLYGQFSSSKTSDTGLPTLSGKSLLRGFPAGQFKAKNLMGGQTEYRYTIAHSRFRITGFIGLAKLSGGSYGQDENSRNDDGWYSAGGIGFRYSIQPKTGVDIRLDMVSTNVGEQAFYLTLNQAF